MISASATLRGDHRAAGSALLAVVVALPFVWGPAAVPDTVFHHQALALGGWGLWLALYRGRDSPRDRPNWALLAVAAALSTLLLHALLRSPVGPRWTDVGLLLGGIAVFVGGTRATPSSIVGWAWGWFAAGVFSVAVALLQYFVPAWPDGTWIADGASTGRAIGNIRQPNQLATLLLCATAMTAWLWANERLPRAVATLAVVAMMFAIALTGSRTGALSLGVLVVWALFDRSLPVRVRRWLAATPLIYLAAWALLALHASLSGARFHGAERLSSGGDISGSRFAIWSNTLELIAQYPLGGVGWGNFNFAWTYTRFADRPNEYYDHCHNLLLQLAVEIGIASALFVLGALAWALWRSRAAWLRPLSTDGRERAVLALLALVFMHSQLEYPLWYAYFLLPALWGLGGAVVGPAAGGAEPAGAPATTSRAWPLRLAGVACTGAALFATAQHRLIEVIFAPPDSAPPLAERIAAGQLSPLFGHHADYAAVTTTGLSHAGLATFRRPLRQLVDARLQIAYIEALHANGHAQAAAYAAQRLREFSNPEVRAFFDPCSVAATAPAFPCRIEAPSLSWQDLQP